MKSKRILAHQLSRPISNEEAEQVYGGTSYITDSPSAGVTFSGGHSDQQMEHGTDDDNEQV